MSISNNGLHFPATSKVHGGRVEIYTFPEREGYRAQVVVINSSFPEGLEPLEYNYIWANTPEEAVARATAFAIKEEIISLKGWGIDLREQDPVPQTVVTSKLQTMLRR